MYVAITGAGKSRVIQFRKDQRIPGTKKKVTRVIKTIGNYERMLAEDPDIIEKLKQEARRLTREEKAENAPITLSVNNQELMSPGQAHASYRFGHALLRQCWQQMGLDRFIGERIDKKNREALAEALQGLLYHRLTDPASVLASVSDLTTYAGMGSVGRDVHYQVLEVLHEYKEVLIDHLCDFFQSHTTRQGPVAYYDVTTHSFESVREGELRMFGFSKSNKSNEVQVVMGLLIDNNGIPITFELFPGNTMDQKTLQTAVARLKEKYKLDRIVIVADRGLNSQDNLEFLLQEGHDFVFAYTLKRSTEALKALALDEEGWTSSEKKGEAEWKEKVVKHTLKVKVLLTQEERQALPVRRGRPPQYKTVEIPVKIHLTWSRERARKDRIDRERVVEKARQLLSSPGQVTQALKRGKNQYIAFSVDTQACHLDEGKIASQARFDGYYAIITNDLGYTTSDVCDLYGGLWKIEESFRVMKTDLEASPAFVWKDERVHGHFTLCFLALCLIRYAQYLLFQDQGLKVSARTLMESWHRPTVMVIGDYPDVRLIPTMVPQAYFDLAQSLKMPALRTCMTLHQFRQRTKLDVNKNLMRDNRTKK